MNIAARIIGFICICLGIGTFAYQVAFLGIHPVAWFIIGAILLFSREIGNRMTKRDEEDNK